MLGKRIKKTILCGALALSMMFGSLFVSGVTGAGTEEASASTYNDTLKLQKSAITSAISDLRRRVASYKSEYNNYCSIKSNRVLTTSARNTKLKASQNKLGTYAYQIRYSMYNLQSEIKDCGGAAADKCAEAISSYTGSAYAYYKAYNYSKGVSYSNAAISQANNYISLINKAISQNETVDYALSH